MLITIFSACRNSQTPSSPAGWQVSLAPPCAMKRAGRMGTGDSGGGSGVVKLWRHVCPALHLLPTAQAHSLQRALRSIYRIEARL